MEHDIPCYSNTTEKDIHPNPIILEDDLFTDEQPINPDKERQLDFQSWLQSNADLNYTSSTFNSLLELFDALLKSKDPNVKFPSSK